MIFSVVNQKGGTGKTTTAVNLAGFYTYKGYDVLLVDADPQQSATAFAEIRAKEALHDESLKMKNYTYTTIAKTGDNLVNDIQAISNKYDITIIDTGGRNSKEMRYAMLISDCTLMPIMASQYDVWSSDDTIPFFRNVKMWNQKLKTFIIMNNINPNPMMSEHKVLAEYFTEENTLPQDVELANSIIYGRVAYRRAVSLGQYIFEYSNEHEKANSDFIALANELTREILGKEWAENARE